MSDSCTTAFSQLADQPIGAEAPFNIAQLNWNADGLIPVIVQANESGGVLMFAWMNLEALRITMAEKQLCYYSRSRQQLWRKGEISGHVQILHELKTDCDGDVLLARVTQKGLACHTGRQSCFYHRLGQDSIEVTESVVISPDDIYK